jgi:hypothetical protein
MHCEARHPFASHLSDLLDKFIMFMSQRIDIFLDGRDLTCSSAVTLL